MKEETVIDLMQELTDESVDVSFELFQEEVAPLIRYRVNWEDKKGNKEIKEMRKMEQEV